MFWSHLEKCLNLCLVFPKRMHWIPGKKWLSSASAILCNYPTRKTWIWHCLEETHLFDSGDIQPRLISARNGDRNTVIRHANEVTGLDFNLPRSLKFLLKDAASADECPDEVTQTLLQKARLEWLVSKCRLLSGFAFCCCQGRWHYL